MKSIALWTAALALVGAASAGFTPGSMTYATPYATPVVETPNDEGAGTFDGLLGLAESLPPSSSLKVLWTHGMCTHDISWVDDRMRRLVASIGGVPQTVSVRPVGSHGAALRTDRIVLRSTTIDVTFLTWSALTAPYKAALMYDHSKLHGGDYPFARATLNRELKRGLINDCMTDVVVYGGPNGVTIRHAAQVAVCDVLGGRVEGTTCNIPPGATPAAFALVTESLGSKLLFDAIHEIWAAAEKSDDTTAVARVANGLAATRMMYMVANQLPLLDAAGMATAGALWDASPQRPATRDTKNVFDLFSRARRTAARTIAPITMVAFSDPNDLLSYRIVPGHLNGNLKDFRIVNVTVSNDTTYFDYIERPDTAHCGYTWNPHVFGMLAKGYRAGKALPLAPDLPGGACPGLSALQN